MMIKKYLCMVFILAVSIPAMAAPVKVAPDNPALAYIGRFTNDYRCGWTGSAIRMKFKGTSVAAKLTLTKGKQAAMEVVIDGKPTKMIVLSPKQQTYVLASGLNFQTHVLELFKRTEGHYGEIRFGGFTLSAGAKVEKLKPQKRKILFIGDSITCGYGNEAPSIKAGNNVRIENGYMSYAAIASRDVKAQAMIIAWSGHGMYRNLSIKHDQVGTLPKLFNQTLPLRKKIKWDQSKFIPQVIVINLGTNDYLTRGGKKPRLTADEFLKTYKKFIKRLHSLFPDAQVIASIGPMRIKPISQWLKRLPLRFDFVHVLVFSSKNRSPKDIGGGYHPSVQGHQKMASHLVPMIQKITHWTVQSH